MLNSVSTSTWFVPGSQRLLSQQFSRIEKSNIEKQHWTGSFEKHSVDTNYLYFNFFGVGFTRLEFTVIYLALFHYLLEYFIHAALRNFVRYIFSARSKQRKETKGEITPAVEHQVY